MGAAVRADATSAAGQVVEISGDEAGKRDLWQVVRVVWKEELWAGAMVCSQFARPRCQRDVVGAALRVIEICGS